MATKQLLPVIRKPSGLPTLPDLDQWINRFYVKSETSNRLYVISQNKTHRHWGCSCMGWKRFRHCKHLTCIGLPVDEVPYEVELK